MSILEAIKKAKGKYDGFQQWKHDKRSEKRAKDMVAMEEELKYLTTQREYLQKKAEIATLKKDVRSAGIAGKFGRGFVALGRAYNKEAERRARNR
jgi:hypothetical protein